MSRRDLVSAQNHAEAKVAPLITNVYIPCFAALNAIACTCQTIVMSLRDWFSVSIDYLWCEQMVGQGEVGWYIYPKGENSMAVSGFGCKILQEGHFSYFKCKWSWKTAISGIRKHGNILYLGMAKEILNLP